jgi:hypothetical protein
MLHSFRSRTFRAVTFAPIFGLIVEENLILITSGGGGSRKGTKLYDYEKIVRNQINNVIILFMS